MNRPIFHTTIALTSALLLSMPAHATSNQAMVDLCLSTMQAAPTTSADTTFRLKGIKGGGLKRLKFEMLDGSERKNVTCKIKGREVKEIEWPNS